MVHETPTAANVSWSKVGSDPTSVHAHQLTTPRPPVIKVPREEVLGASKDRLIAEPRTWQGIADTTLHHHMEVAMHGP